MLKRFRSPSVWQSGECLGLLPPLSPLALTQAPRTPHPTPVSPKTGSPTPFPTQLRQERREPLAGLLMSCGEKPGTAADSAQRTPPHHSCLPVTPLVSMISSAALVTARFRDSLPMLFILLEFRARFCLVVPKASMQESIWQETDLVTGGRPQAGEHAQPLGADSLHRRAGGALPQPPKQLRFATRSRYSP